MIRRPPRSTRTDTLFPYTTLFRSIYHLETAKPVDPARLRAMLQPMQHRGPDGSGEWKAPGVGLAHLRLSIIDIEGSPQPMASDDALVTLTYIGEIYNFRSEARRLGKVLVSTCRTLCSPIK